MVDEPARRRRTPSPARNPVSNILHIRNLTRPFTLGQLQTLLNRTGKMKEEEFWIDKIKSHCLAMYESTEEAEATRLALHGSVWPVSNPKSLVVDFLPEDRMKRIQASEESAPGYKKELPPEPRREVTRDRSRDRALGRGREAGRERSGGRDRDGSKSRERRPSNKERERTERGERADRDRADRDRGDRGDRDRADRDKPANRGRSPAPAAVREWDRDKIRQSSRSPSPRDGRGRPFPDKGSPKRGRSPTGRRSRSRSRSPGRRDRRRSSPGKEAPAPPAEEEPAKLLDNLFNKTKAQPHIYWLPLTDAQVVERLAERERKRLERLKQRAEEEKAEKKRRDSRSRSRSRGRR